MATLLIHILFTAYIAEDMPLHSKHYNSLDSLFDKPGNAVRCEPHNFNCEEKHNLTEVCSHYVYYILAF